MKKLLLSAAISLSFISLISCSTNEANNLNDNTNITNQVNYDKTSIYYDMIFGDTNSYLDISDQFLMLKNVDDTVVRVGNNTDSLDYMKKTSDLTSKDFYAVGDKYEFTFVKKEIIYINDTFNMEGEESRGTPVVGPYVKSEYIPASIVKIDESLIERNAEGYIKNVDLSSYNTYVESLVWYSPKINLDYVITERTQDNLYSYVALNEYNSTLYASVQDNIVFAFYAYDLSLNR